MTGFGISGVEPWGSANTVLVKINQRKLKVSMAMKIKVVFFWIVTPCCDVVGH